MKKESFKKLKLPDTAGVYFFLKGKEILYIGKATSLKDRVKSYFGPDLIETRGPIILDMVFKADSIDWQTTDSVLEAIILEAFLIKKHQPRYNTKEKSDKSFNFVCITKEILPRVIVKRGKEVEHEQKSFTGLYGPFTSGTQLREALKIIRKIFPFLDEKSKDYLEFYRQIHLAPDLNDSTLYLQNIKNIKLFFSGKKKEIFKNLKKEMATYAKAREFEKAGEIKRQVFALQHINDVALLKRENFSHSSQPSSFRIESYDIAHMGGKNMVGVMTVVEDGEVVKSEYKKFKIRSQSASPARAGGNDTGALREVLERRLRHTEWVFPSLIVVDGGVAQLNVAQKVLKEMKLKIDTVSVVKNEQHKPKGIMGKEELINKHKRAILLANSEAHRFAIAYHKNMRNRNFLK